MENLIDIHTTRKTMENYGEKNYYYYYENKEEAEEALLIRRKKKLKRNPLLEITSKKKKNLKGNPDMMVMELDPDILLEIFSQIPFEEAVQCRLVCKSWHTLLDDNFLINIHAKTQLKLHGYDHHQHAHSSSSSSTIVSFISCSQEEKTSLLVGLYDDNLCSYKESSFDDSSSKLFEDATMINSCNGLICLYTLTDFLDRSIAIYNPVTTEFLRLPKHFSDNTISCCLGYHPSTKEYKILSLRTNEYGVYSFYQIYTLGSTGKWKYIIEGPPFKYNEPGVHVNGAFYWIIQNHKNGGHMEGEMIIMSFDLADEEFRILMTLPPIYILNPKRRHYKLVESRGCLFLFVDQYSSPDDDPHLELWVMKEKEKEKENDNGCRYYWSNFMKISTHGHDEQDYEFLALTHSGKVLFWHNGLLTLFDPKEERFASIGDVPASSRGYGSRCAFVPHTNSLVSLIALGAIPKNKNKNNVTC